jgi:hypothetical protein
MSSVSLSSALFESNRPEFDPPGPGRAAHDIGSRAVPAAMDII